MSSRRLRYGPVGLAALGIGVLLVLGVEGSLRALLPVRTPTAFRFSGLELSAGEFPELVAHEPRFCTPDGNWILTEPCAFACGD
jgi:hypothetical protein